MHEIVNEDNQFGRFLFGIFSAENKTERMLQWMKPSFNDAKMFSFNICHFLFVLSLKLSEYYVRHAKLFGQKLAGSLDQLENQIRAERNEKIYVLYEKFSTLNGFFKSGLNLKFLDRKKYPSWSLNHVDKPKWLCFRRYTKRSD